MYTPHLHAILPVTDTPQQAKQAIGISKRCCFCRTFYVHYLNFDFMFEVNSGKAYLWARLVWDNRLDNL